MSALVDRALERAGLLAVARARLRGEPWPAEADGRLAAATLLTVGALADAVRVRSAGDAVGFHDAASAGVVWVETSSLEDAGAGLALLRRVATLRVRLPDAVRIGVNYNELGIELAQVALGFGASELCGRLATKRGLPIADDATKRVKGRGQVSAQELQRDELASLVACVGRRAVFLPNGARSLSLAPPAAPPPSHAARPTDDATEGATHV
ncbi:MAG: hypothetical protein IPF92_05355 [Myxococcales bacterium]|nr:hypothetical protein [Myxococcales bacterium]HQY60750.1 hypothetical protein [Polyangiaceae bacterium]